MVRISKKKQTAELIRELNKKTAKAKELQFMLFLSGLVSIAVGLGIFFIARDLDYLGATTIDNIKVSSWGLALVGVLIIISSFVGTGDISALSDKDLQNKLEELGLEKPPASVVEETPIEQPLPQASEEGEEWPDDQLHPEEAEKSADDTAQTN